MRAGRKESGQGAQPGPSPGGMLSLRHSQRPGWQRPYKERGVQPQYASPSARNALPTSFPLSPKPRCKHRGACWLGAVGIWEMKAQVSAVCALDK